MLTSHELTTFNRLKTPQKLQDFLNTLEFRKPGAVIDMSPRRVLQARKAHCLEGALLAAAVLWHHGHQPLIMDLTSADGDHDHVVALFRRFGRWGAISKTRHAVLRYREPVYRSWHELAMSYFHEYFLDNGKKTMRGYSRPFNLSRFGKRWITTEEDLYDLGAALDDAPHISFLDKRMIKNLRKADPVEIEAGKIVQ